VCPSGSRCVKPPDNRAQDKIGTCICGDAESSSATNSQRPPVEPAHVFHLSLLRHGGLQEAAVTQHSSNFRRPAAAAAAAAYCLPATDMQASSCAVNLLCTLPACLLGLAQLLPAVRTYDNQCTAQPKQLSQSMPEFIIRCQPEGAEAAAVLSMCAVNCLHACPLLQGLHPHLSQATQYMF
jgi:hypothetical protein